MSKVAMRKGSAITDERLTTYRHTVFRDTRFDEDSKGLYTVEIRWRGGATFNVHNIATGQEVDMFTHYGDEHANPPNDEQAYKAASDYFDRLWHEVFSRS